MEKVSFGVGDVLLEIDSSCSCFLVLSQTLLLGVRLKRRGRLRSKTKALGLAINVMRTNMEPIGRSSEIHE